MKIKKTVADCDRILDQYGLKRISEFKNFRTKIKILCVCDKEFETTPHHIENGNTRSCGCYKKKRIRETKLKDLTGQKFGNLTVIKFIKFFQRKAVWLCKCDCGNLKEYKGYQLTTKHVTTCGCRLRSNNGISLTFWKNIVNGARTRNLLFEITIDDAWELFVKQNRKCALTGVTLTLAKYYNKEKQTASLDRIDSSKGYTKDNIQWVHKSVNFMKHAFNSERFIVVCNLIAKIHPRYNIELNDDLQLVFASDTKPALG